MISVEKAFELVDETVAKLPSQLVELADSVGRVLTTNIVADVNSPPHDKSVMDGFAIHSADVAEGTRCLEIVETVIAGGWPTKAITRGQATQIMTGAPIPTGADAVVMVEQTKFIESAGQRQVELDVESVAPEKHVLRTGVNFKKGQIVFPAGHLVRPTDIGLLAEVGAHHVPVGALPTVAVLPTGNELVDCSTLPGRGQIRNSNGPMLLAMARGLGLQVSDLGIGRDEPGPLTERIQAGLDHDLLLLSGGVSAGTMDLVPGILNELGVQQVFHKVHVKPGKPIWFGVLEQKEKRTYVFGLPGNPVSSLIGFQLFVKSAIRKLTGDAVGNFKSEIGQLSSPHQTRGDRPTYWPGKRVNDDSPVRKFQPLMWRGSSDLFALGESDGLIYFPAESQDHPAGEQVVFYPFA